MKLFTYLQIYLMAAQDSLYRNTVTWGFPGGTVIKSPPASAGDTGLIRVWEDPTCCGATKPVRPNYWACALEPVSHNYWAHVPQLLKPAHCRARMPQLVSLRAATTEARTPRARAPQQEKPLQREARAPQPRVAPARRN